jgi:N-acetylglucosamine-6-phosphate deacetylase
MAECFGRDTATGACVNVRFGDTIDSVTPSVEPASCWIAPGWIDLQVNGFAGVDYNSPDTPPDEIARSLQALFATGVTRFYPTVITGAPERIVSSLRNLARCRTGLAAGEAIDGFHVEGPHISTEDGPRGAHPRPWVRPPDLNEFHRWQEAAEGRVAMVTLSPEWPEAPRYIESIVAQGVVAAIGHTAANTMQIADAVSAGATVSTHLGNGAHPFLRKQSNYIWDQMVEDRLMAGFIVDGVHLGWNFLKVALRAKGTARSVLVTDAAPPSGAQVGRYTFGELEIELTPADRVVLAGTNNLAGSALRMDRGVENLVNLAGLPLADAVRMATVNPAVAGRVRGRAMGLMPGERADLVMFRFDDGKLDVLRTWVSGREVFRAAEAA